MNQFIERVKRIAQWLQQPGWPQHAAMIPLGALTCLGDAPFGIALIPVLTLALLFWSCLGLGRKQGFARGWFFGFGLYGAGISWVYVAMNVFGHMAMPLASFFTLLLVAYMALFPGLAVVLLRLLKIPLGVSALLVFPAAWALTEWLRSWLFTGFPWLLIGYSQLDWPMAGYIPWIGVYGMSFMTVLLAGLLLLVAEAKKTQRSRWLAAILGILFLGFLLNLINWGTPEGKELKVSVLQGNISQKDKWKPGQLNKTMGIYTEMIRKSINSDIILLPENALPVFLHKIENDYLKNLHDMAQQFNTAVIVGIPIMDVDTQAYYNGYVVVGAGEGQFRKHHLVPFGEYIPLKGFIGDVLRIMDIPMADFSKGLAHQAMPMAKGFPLALTVCYEDAYVAEVNKKLPKAALLVNGSNNAWYGDSLAPHQHLRISRMRAKETARDSLRATTNGISAVIDSRGRIKVRSPQFRRAGIHGTVQPRSGSTPFVYLGNLTIMFFILLLYTVPLLVLRHKAKN